MIRLTGPLFSEKARKQLGHKLIYKTKGPKSFLTKYNKPGGVAPFDPSPTQRNKRMIYNLIIANWQVKSAAQKKVFHDLVKSKNLKMSGWNYFYREALKDLPTYLELQGYWAFNRIVGGQILDLSGNANHGDLKPLYPSNYPHLVPSLNKKFGKAGSFDGIDDLVKVPYDESQNFGLGSITWEAWIKTDSVQDHQSVIYKRRGVPMWEPMDIRDTGTIRMIFRDVDGVTAGGARGADFNDGNWHHVVTVLNRETNIVRLYKDTVQQGADLDISAVGSMDSINPITIGRGSNYFNGIIDEARIYNRVLSLEEIKKHYDLS